MSSGEVDRKDDDGSQPPDSLYLILYGFTIAAAIAGSQVLFRSAGNINGVLLPLLITTACTPAQACLIFAILLFESAERFLVEALYDKVWLFSSASQAVPKPSGVEEVVRIHIPHGQCCVNTWTFMCLNAIELVGITFVHVSDNVTQVIMWWLIAESVVGVIVYLTLAIMHFRAWYRVRSEKSDDHRHNSVRVWYFYCFYVLHARGVDMQMFVLHGEKNQLWLEHDPERGHRWHRAAQIAKVYQAAFLICTIFVSACVLVLILSIEQEKWSLKDLFSGDNPSPSYCEDDCEHEFNLFFPGEQCNEVELFLDKR